jgi:hypothetical protein
LGITRIQATFSYSLILLTLFPLTPRPLSCLPFILLPSLSIPTLQPLPHLFHLNTASVPTNQRRRFEDPRCLWYRLSCSSPPFLSTRLWPTLNSQHRILSARRVWINALEARYALIACKFPIPVFDGSQRFRECFHSSQRTFSHDYSTTRSVVFT